MFFKKGVQKNFTTFTEKHVLESFFNKKACNFIKKRLQHRCVPVKFAKFLRTSLLQNTSGGCFLILLYSEAVDRWCSAKKIFLQISQKEPWLEPRLKWSCRSIASTFLKKRFQCRCFLVNFGIFLRTPFCPTPAKSFILFTVPPPPFVFSKTTSHKFSNWTLSRLNL